MNKSIQILNKSGSSVGILKNLLEAFLERQPKLQSIPESIYIGKSFNRVLEEAEIQKKSFDDSFLSIEHLLIALSNDFVVLTISTTIPFFNPSDGC